MMRHILFSLVFVIAAGTSPHAQSIVQWQLNGNNIEARDRGGGWVTLGTADPVTHIWGSANYAVNNTALALMSTLTTKVVTRYGFSAAGDAPPLTFVASPSACALNAGAGDGGSQVPSADGKCWLASFPEVADIRQFGCKGDGIFNNTTCMRSALAAHKNVLIPFGEFHITDKLICSDSATISGIGVGGSVITVGNALGNDFNMSASGVVSHTSVYDGCTYKDFRIKFYQPDTPGMTIADIIHYPVAFDGTTTGHQQFQGTIQITHAWDCINYAGAVSGGLEINRVNCSSYHTGLQINNSVAGMHVGTWDQETWGMSADQATVYTTAGLAGTAKSMIIGKCDGCSFDSLILFAQGFTANQVGASITGINIANMDVDSHGCNIINSGGGNLRIANLQWTAGDTSTGKLQQIGTGTTVIGNFKLTSSNPSVADIKVTNGSLVMGNGSYTSAATAAPLVEVTGGNLLLNNTVFNYTAGNRSQAFIKLSGGSSTITNNVFPAAGAATGSAFDIPLDTSTNYVSNNALNGWDVTLGFTTALGYYDFGDFAFALTPAPHFNVDGTFSPTGQVHNSYMHRRGAYVDTVINEIFTTNAYTGASGQFLFTIAAPVNISGSGTQPCSAAFYDNITSAEPITVYSNGNSIGMARFISNAIAVNLQPVNIPPSKANIRVIASCRTRVR